MALSIRVVRKQMRGGLVVQDGDCFIPKIFSFPGGELQVELPKTSLDMLAGSERVHVDAVLQSSNDVMSLLLLVEAIRAVTAAPLHFAVPYFPCARQDRRANPGEAFSLKVMAKLINDQGFASVMVADPHSDVLGALLDRVVIQDASVFLQRVLRRSGMADVAFVAPDLGAVKRVRKLAQQLGVASVVCADKVRDTKTGALSGTRLLDPIPAGVPLLLVDDICDGGRTFTELASVVRETGCVAPMSLYVTHGIFSKGLGGLASVFDRVYCPYPWMSDSEIAQQDFLVKV